MLTLPWTPSEPECERGRPASLEARELRTKPLHFCGMKVPKAKAVVTKALHRTHEAWPCGAVLTRAHLGESPRWLRARLSPPCSSARANRSRRPRGGLVCSLGVCTHMGFRHTRAHTPRAVTVSSRHALQPARIVFTHTAL